MQTPDANETIVNLLKTQIFYGNIKLFFGILDEIVDKELYYVNKIVISVIREKILSLDMNSAYNLCNYIFDTKLNIDSLYTSVIFDGMALFNEL